MNSQYERSNNYRKEFFKHNEPILGKYYVCAYCGKPCSSQKITVDHIMPIAKVRNRKGFFNNIKAGMYRKILKLFTIDNINDKKNLVPACKRCNSKKGAKAGLWLIKGLLGRHLTYWIVHWLFVLGLLISALVLIF